MNCQMVAQAPKKSSTPSASGVLQRKCDKCREEDKILQRSAVGSAPETVPSIVHEVLRSPGQPLDASTRAFEEQRFGHDFSKVRVHTDRMAVESAQSINALAYTAGRHIVLSDRGGNPRFLAHELAHVVQQGRGNSSSCLESISSPDGELEQEANRASDEVVKGRSFRPSLLTGVAVHRQPASGGSVTLTGLTATRESFKNTGAPDANNCAVGKPAALGVDGPSIGQNGMEMIFRIHGTIPSGTEFDITRTKATGVWQFNGGAWSRLGGWRAGTSDDRHDQDECLIPVSSRIFVVDTPGPDGTLNPAGNYPGVSTPVATTATAAVWKLSFNEWVIARNRRLGIGWRRISTPVFHNWHSIFSVRLVGGVWRRVDTPSGQHNEIKLGSIGTTGTTP